MFKLHVSSSTTSHQRSRRFRIFWTHVMSRPMTTAWSSKPCKAGLDSQWTSRSSLHACAHAFCMCTRLHERDVETLSRFFALVCDVWQMFHRGLHRPNNHKVCGTMQLSVSSSLPTIGRCRSDPVSSFTQRYHPFIFEISSIKTLFICLPISNACEVSFYD